MSWNSHITHDPNQITRNVWGHLQSLLLSSLNSTVRAQALTLPLLSNLCLEASNNLSCLLCNEICPLSNNNIRYKNNESFIPGLKKIIIRPVQPLLFSRLKCVIGVITQGHYHYSYNWLKAWQQLCQLWLTGAFLIFVTKTSCNTVRLCHRPLNWIHAE